LATFDVSQRYPTESTEETVEESKRSWKKMAALKSTVLAAAALLLATLQAQPAVADEAPASAANAFQMTVGSAGDFPGATGMAYRYLDASPLGGWVVGGWAQGASAIARVGVNGSVIWSHRLHYNFSDHPWPCTDQGERDRGFRGLT
jgi:hypothetical protein